MENMVISVIYEGLCGKSKMIWNINCVDKLCIVKADPGKKS